MANRVFSVDQGLELLLKLKQAGLGAIEAQSIIESPENQLARQIVGNIRRYSSNKLLKLTSTINVSRISKFIALDHLKIGETEGIKICYLSDNIKNHFLKKVERDIPKTQLKSFRLTKYSPDSPIITALGDNYETYLAQIWELLKTQPKGEAGILFTNYYYSNIFYIRDTDNILWSVAVSWFADGWFIRARSVDGPDRWDVGNQVFGC